LHRKIDKEGGTQPKQTEKTNQKIKSNATQSGMFFVFSADFFLCVF